MCMKVDTRYTNAAESVGLTYLLIHPSDYSPLSVFMYPRIDLPSYVSVHLLSSSASQFIYLSIYLLTCLSN